MKRGFVSVETFLGLVFVLMLSATLISVYKFMAHQPNPTTNSGMIAAYQNLFERMRTDFRFAVKAEQTPDSLTLTNAQQKTVTYTLSEGTLSRKVSEGSNQSLLGTLHSGGFFIASPGQQLVSVWLIPENSFAPPFFTSFALQGGKR